jgi:hypothetical protein
MSGNIAGLFNDVSELGIDMLNRTTDTTNTPQQCRGIIKSIDDGHGVFTVVLEREGTFNPAVEAIISCSQHDYMAGNKYEAGELVYVQHTGGRFNAKIMGKVNDMGVTPKMYALNHFYIGGVFDQ